MADTYKIQFIGDLEVKDMISSVDQLQRKLNALSVPKQLSNSFNSSITKINNELKNFNEIVNKGELDQKGQSDLIRSYEKINSLVQAININIQNLGNEKLEKLVPPSLVSRFEQISNLIKQVNKNIEGDINQSNQITEYTKKIEEAQQKIEDTKKSISALKGVITKNDNKSQAEEIKTINEELEKLKRIADKNPLKEGLSVDDLDNFKTKEKELGTIIDRTVEKLKDRKEAFKIYEGADNEEVYRQTLAQEIAELEEQLSKKQIELTEVRSNIGNIEQYKQYQEQIDTTQKKLESLVNAENKIQQKIATAKEEIKKQQSVLNGLEKTIDNLMKKIEEAQNKINQNNPDKINEIKKEIEQLLGAPIATNNLKDLQSILENLKNNILSETRQKLHEVQVAEEDLGNSAENTEKKMRQETDAMLVFNDATNDVQAIANRIKYFFSLNNAINLTRRALRDAFNTIKELDKAMTATAVVTNFTVGDMWDQLPDYTKRANELGVSTKAVYESATLYYQQGLKQNEVMAMSNETLKMARIAGLDAAVATDRMTNAIRGFNMEINEVNAQKIDDVYSRLAAISASNVDEISTAMTKVASLAHSANMEFETTSAFLAQMIETTRESAETAGTALKTVVARFSEVKKLVNEKQLKGQDEEGELIDVNKVSAALRTAGIDLNKYFLGEVGLDDIFIELASKWDSLTIMQQRYIATQAAGSRQQSRFIAMMSDYARTQELVTEAYNANGAAAKQFEKTQESLESKLARLTNAWHEFTMGITNSTFVKTSVDILTTILNVVNKITSGFGHLNGNVGSFINSLLKIGTALSMLKLGKGILGGMAGSLAGFLIPGSSNNFLNGFSGALGISSLSAGEIGKKVFSPWLGAYGLGKTGFKKLKGLGKGLGGKLSRTPQSSLDEIFAMRQLEWYGFEEEAAEAASEAVGKLGAEQEAAAASASVLGTSLGTLLVAVVSITAAIAALYLLWSFGSIDGRIKRLEKMSQSLDKVHVEAKKLADSTQDIINKYKELTKTVNEANDSLQRNQAISERNSFLNETLANNPNYSKYITTKRQDGQIIYVFDEKGFNKNEVEPAKKAEQDVAINNQIFSILEKGLEARKLEMPKATTSDFVPVSYEYNDKGEIIGYYTTDAYFPEGDNIFKPSEEQAGKASQLRSEVASGMYNVFNQLIGNKLPDQLAENAAEVLSSTFDANEYYFQTQDTLKEAFGGFWEDINTLREEYKKEYGYEASENLSKEELQTAITASAARKNLDNQLDVITRYKKDEKAQDIIAALGGNYEGSAEDLKELLDYVEKNYDQYQELLEIGFGIQRDNNELTDKFNQGYKVRETRYAKAIVTLIHNSKVGYKDASEIIKKFSPQQIKDFNQLTESLNIYSKEFSDTVTSEVAKKMSEGEESWNNSPLKILAEGISENPIDTVYNLQKATKSTDEAVRKLANDLLGLNDNQISKATQVQWFLTSDEYTEISKQLSEFREENGKITSDNIREVAKSCADLDKLLKNGAVSAKGLAYILNKEISFNDINNSLLGAVNAMDDLEDQIKSIIDEYNNFDPGYDENDIASFYTKAYEAIIANIDKGAYGNNQIKTYLEEIFGEGILDVDLSEALDSDAYAAQYEQLVDKYTEILRQMAGGNASNYWKQIAAGWKEATKDSPELQDLVQWIGDELVLNIGNMNTNELVKTIAEKWNIPEKFAQALVADAKNNSSNLAHMLEQNNIPKIIEGWLNELGENSEGKQVYTNKQLQQLSDLTGIDFNSLNTQLQKANLEYVEIENLAEKYQNLNSKYGHIEEEGVGTLYDYTAILDDLSAQGLADQIDEVMATLVENGGVFYAKINDKYEQIILDGSKTATEAYKEKVDEVTNHEAEQIINLLDGNGVDINTALNRIAEFFKKNATQTITIHFNPDQIKINGEDVVEIISAKDVAPTASNVDTGPTKVSRNAKNGRTRAVGEAIENTRGYNLINLLKQQEQDEADRLALAKENEEKQAKILEKQETNAKLSESIAEQNAPIIGNKVIGPGTSYGKSPEGSYKEDKGSGGSSEKEPEEWKNEFDWLYNIVSDLEELQRQEGLLQKEQTAILHDQNKTGHDLYKNLISQYANLRGQLAHQQELQTKRSQELRELVAANNQYEKYVWYNTSDKSVEIDWNEIEAIQDKEIYDAVKAFADEVEGVESKIEDTESAILDIEEEMHNLEIQYRDAYIEFENRVEEALIQQYQDTIDQLSTLNDTITESNNNILSSIQEQLDLERQIRDNTKTEEDIADKQARLAYLQRDTTGGNETEILKLQQEIEDAQENYTDTLVDQSIQKLQNDNEKAAQQRQQQISMMQEQLDWNVEQGAFNDEVSKLLDESRGSDGKLLNDSQLVTLLRNYGNWDAMTEAERDQWSEELEEQYKQWDAYEEFMANSEKGTFWSKVEDATQRVTKAIGDYSQSKGRTSLNSSGGGSGGSSGKGSKYKDSDDDNDVDLDVILTRAEASKQTLKAVLSNQTAEQKQKRIEELSKPKSVHISGGGRHAYAKGGLNDYTGWSWLDGTPSEPEYVLNARQTEAFLKLADILPSFIEHGLNQTSITGGNVYVELTMNVDQISNDYDVDRIVDRVKADIETAASYRNVNSISLLR